MAMFTQDTDSLLGAIGVGVAGALAAVKWWYHMKKLSHLEGEEGTASSSIVFVIKELREELIRAKGEHVELRERISRLEKQNEFQRRQIEKLREGAVCASCAVPFADPDGP